MTKLSLTLRYHWKAVLGWGLATVLGIASFTLASHFGVRAGMTCADWDRPFEGFTYESRYIDGPHRSPSAFVTDCLESGEVNINQTNNRGQTLLMRVIRNTEKASFPDRFEVAQVLLAGKERYGLNLEARDQYGKTAMYYATGNLTRLPFALLLREAGASSKTTNSAKRRAHAATYSDVLALTFSALRNPLKEDIEECADMSCLVDRLTD